MNKLYAILFLIFCAPVSFAQCLTIEECRQMALENSHNLKSAEQKVLASKDLFRAYKANYLPNISAIGGYYHSTASFSHSITGGYLPTFSPDLASGEMLPNIVGFGKDGTPIFSSYAYMPDIEFDFSVGGVFSMGVQVVQPIYTGGKITAASRLARLGVEVATIEQSRTQQDVCIMVEEAFYTYVKVQEMLQAAQAYSTTVTELHRQVQSLYNAGMCTKNDLLSVEVKLNEAQLQQNKAQNGLTLARMNLCYVIGLPLTTKTLEVVDSFDFEHNINHELDVTTRYEYKLLEKNIEAKEQEVRLAQSDFLPNLSAMASYGYTDGLSLNGSKLMSSPSFSGGVVLSVPIFHWGEGRRKVSAARREVEIVENTQADLVQKMILELMQSIHHCNETRQEVLLREKIVEQATENLRQSQQQYNIGTITLFQHLESQTLWQKAITDLVESKASQRLAYLHYIRSSGRGVSFPIPQTVCN